MKIIVENNIPYLRGLLEPYASVTYLESEDINAETVSDADALLVRTRTQCNAKLLAGSKCTFVGTATIGLDHIDRKWCENQGITTVNAPGCNAPAVAQYVLASIMQLINRPVSQYTLGIVGVGHVGSIVDRWARSMGMTVMLCDPPRQERGDVCPAGKWHSLDELAAKADIITFHTPLSREGKHPSHHLAGKELFDSLRRHPIVINSARGPVVDTPALLDAIRSGQVSHAVIDTWEGEPGNISKELLRLADIATPHIAGYSREGKVRASRMVLDSLCSHFNLPQIEMDVELPAQVPDNVTPMTILHSYDPRIDTETFRREMAASNNAHETFERLRNFYDLRKEPHQAKED